MKDSRWVETHKNVNMTDSSDEETAAIAITVAMILKKKVQKRKRKKRSVWVKPYLQRRAQLGAFECALSLISTPCFFYYQKRNFSMLNTLTETEYFLQETRGTSYEILLANNNWRNLFKAYSMPIIKRIERKHNKTLKKKYMKEPTCWFVQSIWSYTLKWRFSSIFFKYTIKLIWFNFFWSN